MLVDLDQRALARAVEQLPPQCASRVEQKGGVDLTGILTKLSSWTGGSPLSDTELTATIETGRTAPAPDDGTFDVVGSMCVLTQLIDSIYLGLGKAHPRGIELVLAVRNRHLEVMIELLKPGGVGVLVTDFVSTETAPEIARLGEAQFPAAALEWLERRNFFTGANPFAIRDFFRSLATTGWAVEDVGVTAPWRWDIGAKQFAVSAVTFRRGR
jgi:hypothetical protein